MATHPWQTASGWFPKPTNWRQRYWHRPPSYTWPRGADVNAYRAWLTWEGRDPDAVIAAQHELMRRPLVQATHNNATAWEPPDVPYAPRKPKRMPKPEPKVKPMSNVEPFPPAHEREAAPVHASEADRRQAAAELLREIAGQYGPRRAHKLIAMAQWLVAAPAARVAQSAGR